VDDLFYQLGRRTGRSLRRGRWLVNAFAGSESDAIAAERAAGRDLARAFEQAAALDPDSEGSAAIDRIADRLTGRLKNRERSWRVQLVRDTAPGAFALPGGFLYVTRGLIDVCAGDEHELAWVIGHEMGHVVHGHAAARIASEWLGSAAAQVAAGGSGPLGRWILGTGARAVSRAYSRDQELQADRFGGRLARAAGFDPHAALRVCGRLEDFESRSDAPLAEYFASHPPLPVRADALRRWLAEEGLPESP
jgi:predicted Zn-dependent protease